MNIFQLDPIRDHRWEELVDRHPRASVFHTRAWLEALQSTYGYEPVVFTASRSTAALENGVVFCRVNSWITGHRLISLPFSDHCEPLCDSPDELNFIIRYLQTALERQSWKYLEVRSADWNLGQATEHHSSIAEYWLHAIDLHSPVEDVFRSLDKDSVQGQIRRAEGAGLVEKSGRSDELLTDFYGLLVMTRRRHGLPPIPRSWFRNLIRCQGDALEMHVAYMGEIPVAAVLTLYFRDSGYYKYGCSDSRFHNLGAMTWLLWRAMCAAKSRGAVRFDLGRTEQKDGGLVGFKSDWVGCPKRLAYWTFPEHSSLYETSGWKRRLGNCIISYMPNRLLPLSGRLIYRHIA